MPNTTSAAAPADETLGERLQRIIDTLPADALTLAELRDALGQDGPLFFAALLTLVFLIPVSIPGVSTVFGAAILFIGICRLFNRTLWLPRRVLARPLPAARLREGLSKGLSWFHRLERISRPHRGRWLSAPGPLAVVNDLAFILGATALVAPLEVTPELVRIDLPVMVAVSLVCIPVFLTGRTVSRREGIAFIVVYAAYLGALLLLRT